MSLPEATLTPTSGMTKSAAQRRIEGQLQAAVDLLKLANRYVGQSASVRARDLSQEICEFVGQHTRK